MYAAIPAPRMAATVGTRIDLSAALTAQVSHRPGLRPVTIHALPEPNGSTWNPRALMIRASAAIMTAYAPWNQLPSYVQRQQVVGHRPRHDDPAPYGS